MGKVVDYLKANWRRIFMSLAGVIICAVSVGVFKLAALGVDPFQSLMSGLDALILLLFSIFADRHNIGIATFINLFLLGYITQYTYEFLQKVIPDPSMIVRVICLIIGIVVICFGSALYMTADLGVSTYDAVAIVMANKWKMGKFKYIRICTDLVCVVLGCILFVMAGNPIGKLPTIAGIGTIVTAFFMGPLIDLFNEKIAKPLLNKK